MSSELRQALEQVAERFRALRLWSGLAVCWLVLAVARLGPGRTAGRGPWAARLDRCAVLVAWLCCSASAGACIVFVIRDRPATRAGSPGGSRPRIPTWAPACWPPSRKIRRSPTARLGYLQRAVHRQALDHRRTHDWGSVVVPDRRLRGGQARPRGGARALLAVFGHARAWAGSGRGCIGADRASARRRPDMPPTSRSSPATPRSSRARRCWSSPASRPPCPGRGEAGRRRAAPRSRHAPMTRSLEDPTFAGRVESVDADLSYRVEFGGRDDPRLTASSVFEYPELERGPTPSSTSRPTPALEPKTVEDIRHVTAVEGTELTLTLPPQQGGRLGEAGRREGPEIAAHSASDSGGTRLHRGLHAGRFAPLQGPARRPRRAARTSCRPRSP